jgi:uncharacterized membrane protein
MVLRRIWAVLAAVLIALVSLSGPAVAHKDHDKEQQTEQAHVSASQAGSPAAAQPVARGVPHVMTGEMMNHGPAGGEGSSFDRFLDWIGRWHPILIHFPIAFFPAALFTAIIGRRRPAFAAPVQFLVLAGGVSAPVAALLGWFDAAGMDPDPLLNVHRWLGTAIGALAIPLVVWAWRKPERDRSGLMIVGLSTITAAIVVQGWYGGALVHGMDHMNW